MTTRIGLAGWSYPDWKGRVYPAKPPRGFDPLAYLAGYFDTIEINSTFYRIPTVKMTRDWGRLTHAPVNVPPQMLTAYPEVSQLMLPVPQT